MKNIMCICPTPPGKYNFDIWKDERPIFSQQVVYLTTREANKM